MKRIAFVDPFSSPQFLAEALRSKKVSPVAIYNQKLTPGILEHFYRAYDFDIVCHTSKWELATLLKCLQDLHVEHIFYGNEFSVSITDQLANKLCPRYANDPQTSAWRWNKYDMDQRIMECGLPHIKQIRVGNKLTHAEQKEISEIFTFPVAVKPVQAGGTQGYAKCNSLSEVVSHLAEIPEEHLSLYANAFVVQEFIVGEEYIVNTASLEGKHWVSDVFRNVKHYYKNSNIYQRTEIVDPDEEVWQVCITYVKNVLDMLGFHNGLAHTEVFYNEKGPLLLEVNPRIVGAEGFISKIAKLVYNWSQPELLMDALMGLLPNELDYRCKSWGYLVYLNNWEEQHTLRELNIALLQKLISFKEAKLLHPVGSILGAPTNLLDTAAYALLHSHDLNQLKEDYDQLMSWEKEGTLF
ncbi:MAG: ATP-grasp domain-containing protein [Chloroflexota bacterium]